MLLGTGQSSTALSTLASPPAETTAPGYPTPVVLHSHGYIGGYYLDGDNADVAVLSVPSFNGENVQNFQEYQMVAQIFFADAKAAGKKKLIIDLSANGGGLVYLGYDLFKQVSKEPISRC